MNLNAKDLDMIFNGTGAVINTAQNVCDALSSGVNDVRNVVENSRRNMGVSNGYGYNYNYNQTVTYPYGYSDNSYPVYNQNGFASLGSNPTSPTTGYPGFTDPGYGAMSGPGQSYNFGNNNGPVGGAWG